MFCDPLLRIEIDESRAMNKQTERPNIIEDFTQESEEEEDSDWITPLKETLGTFMVFVLKK